jgi:hypothetical protein
VADVPSGLSLTKSLEIKTKNKEIRQEFWRWSVALRITGFSDFVRRPVF